MKSIEIDGIEYRLFDYLYAVSKCGKVLRKLAPYSPPMRQDGYLTVGSRRLMHRVVASCWIENPNNAAHVHHKNGIRHDNRADNLEWVTPKEHFGDRHHEIMGKYERTEQTRQKLRQNRLGKVTSEETKEKQRAALIGKKRPFFHRAKHTDEWRVNASLKHPRNTGCRIDGIEYRSFSVASRALGIKKMTLRKRCLSKNFPDYELI